ncbi:hypothetical protein K504DRAFT_244072 [Pleomassaria siparia CBS 279.74]|uniref:Uncharacterized protein n=1 Tax=Pleomassaria siparia CBS 279.74 TaxID=1314801 RepID=A0A6G1KFR4_9PLEO|nr:hypothetical protein K504DRAFT_244072 [Pleomassaria siparia CBS 279.74]
MYLGEVTQRGVSRKCSCRSHLRVRAIDRYRAPKDDVEDYDLVLCSTESVFSGRVLDSFYLLLTFSRTLAPRTPRSAILLLVGGGGVFLVDWSTSAQLERCGSLLSQCVEDWVGEGLRYEMRN